MPDQILQDPEGRLRRSGRCRTVNSIYAQSIGELKKENKLKYNIHRRLSKKDSMAQDDYSLNYEQRAPSPREDPELPYQKASVMDPDGSYRNIYVLVEGPAKKAERRSTRMIKPPQNTKKEFTAPPPSKFKPPKAPSTLRSTKEIPKEATQKQQPTSLLNIMLSAAMKVKDQEEQQGREQESYQNMDDQMDIEDDMDNDGDSASLNDSDEMPKGQFKSQQRIKGSEKDEAHRKLLKMEIKFENLRKRFYDVRPRMLSLFN